MTRDPPKQTAFARKLLPEIRVVKNAISHRKSREHTRCDRLTIAPNSFPSPPLL